MTPLRIGSLFSGIGGLELGLERASVGRVEWQCEIDPFCRAVLARHWPDAARYHDVSEPNDYAPVDLVCGGFPCQDVSSAGRRVGLAGERSGLWRHFARIVGQLRPRFVVVENVASGARLWLPHVRHDLHVLGYGTRAVALSAADVGAPHLRRRVFVVADAHGEGELARALDAEVGGAPEAPADPDGDAVRVEPGRRGGPGGPLPAVAGVDGEAGPPADPRPPRREGTGAGVHEGWSRSSDGVWGPPLGGLVPVVHGLPGALAGRGRRERIRALGNAVVPQCAEVIGRILVEMAGDGA